MSDIRLVLGGARSGKSRFAEALVSEPVGLRRVYVATAQAFDEEMELRIATHRAQRGDGWLTVEAPHDLADALLRFAVPGNAVLVDCLTLWLSNRLLAEADLEADAARLVAVLGRVRAPVVLVANEVGLSIVPDNALARRFRDAAGRLNQMIAAIADQAYFVVAGLSQRLK